MSAIDIKNPGAKNAELQGALMRLIEDEPFVSTGTTTGRTLQTRFGDTLNIKDFGAIGNGIADDSAALTAAVNLINADFASPKYIRALYIPAGKYKLTSPPPTFLQHSAVIGDGPHHSILYLDPAFAGDALSWSDAWSGGSYNGSIIPNTVADYPAAGPYIRDIAIWGHRGAAGTQHGLTFYDRNDYCDIQNIECRFLKGSALRIGVPQRRPQAYMRESLIYNFRAERCGSAGVPVVDFNCFGAAESTNEIRIHGMNIYAPNGPGVWIRSPGPQVAGLIFQALRVEGIQNNPDAFAGDLIRIGDPAMSGLVNSIAFRDARLINPYNGYAGLRLTASAPANMPYLIDFYGGVSGTGQPTGKGIIIDYGRTSTFRVTLATLGEELTIANTPNVSGEIIMDAYGRQGAWTTSIANTTLLKYADYDNVLEASVSYDPPSLADGEGVTTTVTVTGVATASYIDVSFPQNLQGLALWGWVSGANTVSVRFQNETGGAVDLASGLLRVRARAP